ncbi:hypothetical protein [Flavobacterium sp.]|uniref:hypothetical protein n=1 Tax=Flavobacterium sp. TaxID=239 RepID=UPI003751D307
MRTTDCKLSKAEVADKKNSHIVSKFFGKELFISDIGNHAEQIHKSGKSRKIYSIPKEDFILCSNCEKKFEVLETYFAIFFNKLRDYLNFPEDFSFQKLGSQDFISCKKLNPTLFKLFIYSLIWRLSISKHQTNENFILPNKIEEELREFLNQNLSVEQQILLKSVEMVKEFPSYDLCIIKPENKTDNFKGMYSAFQMSESAYLLVLVDFILFFYIDDSTDIVLKKFSNGQNENVIIPISDDERWFDLNKLIVSKMLNN